MGARVLRNRILAPVGLIKCLLFDHFFALNGEFSQFYRANVQMALAQFRNCGYPHREQSRRGLCSPMMTLTEQTTPHTAATIFLAALFVLFLGDTPCPLLNPDHSLPPHP